MLSYFDRIATFTPSFARHSASGILELNPRQSSIALPICGSRHSIQPVPSTLFTLLTLTHFAPRSHLRVSSTPSDRSFSSNLPVLAIRCNGRLCTLTLILSTPIIAPAHCSTATPVAESFLRHTVAHHVQSKSIPSATSHGLGKQLTSCHPFAYQARPWTTTKESRS